MKRNITITLILSVIAYILTGCNKTIETPDPEIIITDCSISVPAEGSKAKFAYSIENPIEGESIFCKTSAEWISNFNYDKDGEVSFDVFENLSDERTATIEVQYTDATTVTVTVSQMAVDESISIQPDILSFTPQGGTMDVTVTSGTQWSLEGDCNWAEPSITEGQNGDVVTFTVSENTSDDPRETEFTFNCVSQSVKLKIQQSYTGRIIVEQDVYNISGEAQVFNINIQTNIDVKCTINEGSEWLSDITTRSMETVAFSFEVTENQGNENRTAVITFSNDEVSEQINIIQEPAFPANVLDAIEDDVFREYIAGNFDTNGDGILTKEEALAITKIELSSGGVKSLKGIEYLRNLEEMTFTNNSEIESIDLSNNNMIKHMTIYSNNALKDLNLNGCDKLESITASFCDIQAFDITSLTSLKELVLAYNKNLSGLDVSNNTELEILNLNGTSVKSVDISNNSKLKELSVGTSVLESIDLSTCPELIKLNLSGASAISEVDLSNNKLLEDIDLSKTSISSLNNSVCTKLARLTLEFCSNLTIVDVSKNLKLNYLSLLQCYALEKIIMTEGQYIASTWGVDSSLIEYVEMVYPEDCSEGITDSNLKNYILSNYDTNTDGKIDENEVLNVNRIECPNMGINSFDGMDWFTNISYIDLSDNNLESIDIGSFTNLTELNLSGNMITTISFARTKGVTSLNLSSNQLTEIDNFSNLKNLVTADLSNNKLTAINADYLMKLTDFNVSNNELSTCSVHYDTKLAHFDCSYNNLTELNIWTLSGVVTFNCSDNPLINIKHTTYMKGLTELNCSRTDIVTLDLSQNTVLSKLDAIECPNLTDIYVGDNVIGEINVDDGVNIINGTPSE